MKLRNNKKGFTLVELVIVIAVIAILAAVLIPTFGSVINNANKGALQSEASSLYHGIMMEYAEEGGIDDYCEWYLENNTSDDNTVTQPTIETQIYKDADVKFGNYVSKGTTIEIASDKITLSTDKYSVNITVAGVGEVEKI